MQKKKKIRFEIRFEIRSSFLPKGQPETEKKRLEIKKENLFFFFKFRGKKKLGVQLSRLRRIKKKLILLEEELHE